MNIGHLLREKVRKLQRDDKLEPLLLEDGKIVACTQIGLLVNRKFVVDWNLLRRCNFSLYLLCLRYTQLHK